jgi:hypothetical protein
VHADTTGSNQNHFVTGFYSNHVVPFIGTYDDEQENEQQAPMLFALLATFPPARLQ